MKFTFFAILMFMGGADALESACHSTCFQCMVRCKQRSSDVKTCQDTCLELKRTCCATCGKGPGPRLT